MRIVGRLAQISPSATMAAGERAQRLRDQGVDVIDLGPGQPDFGTPRHICEAGERAIAEGRTTYTASSGIAELRQALARITSERHDIDYRPAEVIVTCGGKHALYNVFAGLVEEGDEVIVPTPYWVSFPEQVRLMGGEPVFVDAAEDDGFSVRAAAVEDACTDGTRAIVLNSPCNPTGAVYARSVLEDLARLAIERDLVLVYDETYDRFLYDGQRHASPLDLGPEAKDVTVLVGSCSKTYAMTGWRIGWAIGPRELVDAAGRLQSHLTSNPTSISQWAALAAVTGDQGPVDDMLRAFAERRELVATYMKQMPGVSCAPPLGAFYAFPNVGELLSDRLPTSNDLASYLIDEAHVVTVPGTAFGRDGYLRLSFAVDIERLREGLERIADAFGRLPS